MKFFPPPLEEKEMKDPRGEGKKKREGKGERKKGENERKRGRVTARKREWWGMGLDREGEGREVDR